MKIVNEKLEGGNNYLHLLINRLTNENYAEVAEMIRLMLVNRCNPNVPNNQLETPFYLLLVRLRQVDDKSDLVNFFMKKSLLDIHSHDDIVDLMAERDVMRKLPARKEPIKNFGFMMKHLEHFNEARFVKEFKEFQEFSQDYQNELAQFMEAAIARDLIDIVLLMLDNVVDVNQTPKDSKFNMSPAFLACTFGHNRILKLLLNNVALRFTSEDGQRSLLHQICSSQRIHVNDRQKCFDFIITDRRCTLEIINALDDCGQTALFYASHYGYHEIALELLRRGAFVGHKSIINTIERDVLSEFLDECVKCSNEVTDKDCEIHVDLRFLMPSNCKDTEVRSVHYIACNRKLKDLILHPVISAFLYIKWRTIDVYVYVNLFIYFICMMFLGFFIISFFYDHNTNSDDLSMSSRLVGHEEDLLDLLLGIHDDDDTLNSNNISESIIDTDLKQDCNRRNAAHFETHAWSYRFCLIFVLSLTIYEIIQCVTSFKKYFFKFSNWLDIILIFLSYIVLIGWCSVKPEDFKKIRAVTILVMAAQIIQLVSKVSFLSMSLHMAIFNKVSTTFLKTIALYLILIIAFAMSFYTLNDSDGKMFSSITNQVTVDPASDVKIKNEDYGSFSDPFISLITTVRMMLSDFEHVKIKPDEYFQGLLFLLFVVFITVVLFNLLNALAISSTRKMVKDAELVDSKKRITMLKSYEKFFSYLKFSFINVFPDTTTITIFPNRNEKIRIKSSVNTSESVSIFMGPHGQSGKMENVSTRRKLMFWKKEKSAKILCHKTVRKLTDFVRKQNEKASMHRNFEKQLKKIKKEDDPNVFEQT